jgi:hypothetical protein
MEVLLLAGATAATHRHPISETGQLSCMSIHMQDDGIFNSNKVYLYCSHVAYMQHKSARPLARSQLLPYAKKGGGYKCLDARNCNSCPCKGRTESG